MVGRVCLKCRTRSDYVAVTDLPDLKCEHCETSLTVSQEVEHHRNYYYLCPKCRRQWRLASVLPSWNQLFPYSGLAADQDIHR